MPEENTLARPGEFDALEKARPDELIFPLLERDPCAPATIIYWCGLRRSLAFERFGHDIPMSDDLKNELRQCMEAELIALEMTARAKGGAAEVAGKRATYGGGTVEKPIIDELMSKARAKLAEADYQAHEAIAIGGQLIANEAPQITPELMGDLKQAAETLHRITLTLSPYRAQYLAEGELPLPEPSGD